MSRIVWIVGGVVVLVFLGLLGWWWVAADRGTPSSTEAPGVSAQPSPSATPGSLKFTVGESTELFSGGYADPVLYQVGATHHMLLNRFGTNFSFNENGYFVLTSPDGVTWTEATETQFPGIATGRVLKFGDQYRFYYPTQAPATGKTGESSRIKSAVSTDGLTFTNEAGVRLTPRDGYSLEGMGLLTLPDGSYQMYFNENIDSSGQRKESEIWGARSTDGQTWTRDAEATLVSESGVEGAGGWPQMLHPFVISRPRGGYLMFYNSHSRVYYATSTDGQTWEKQGRILEDGADVDGYYETDDRIRLYYGDFDPATGGLVYMTTLTEK